MITEEQQEQLCNIMDRYYQDPRLVKKEEMIKALVPIQVKSPKGDDLIGMGTFCVYKFGCLLRSLNKSGLNAVVEYVLLHERVKHFTLGFFGNN